MANTMTVTKLQMVSFKMYQLEDFTSLGDLNMIRYANKTKNIVVMANSV